MNSAAPSQPLVLVIDDDQNLRELLALILRRQDLNVMTAESGAQGLELIQLHSFDVVLLDIGLPDMDGFEVCRHFKTSDALRHIPIILITGRESIEDKVRGFELGASDYINKPFDEKELRVRVLAVIRAKLGQDQWLAANRRERSRTQQELLRISKAVDSASDAISITDAEGKQLFHNHAFLTLFEYALNQADWTDGHRAIFVDPKRRDYIWDTCRSGGSWRGELEMLAHGGRRIAMLARADAIKDDRQTVIGSVWIFTDIQERKRLERELIYLASHDSLTNLRNRRSFAEQLEASVLQAKRGYPSTLIYLDLDHFKNINDTLGHSAGDRMLREIAVQLAGGIRNCDVLARLGGDEFGVLLPHSTLVQAEVVARKILRICDEFRHQETGQCFTTSASIGLAAVEASLSVDEVLARADCACNLAKAKGRNRVETFRPDDAELARLSRETSLGPMIKDALRDGRFELWLQPIVALDGRGGPCFEVLLRMRDVAGKMIMPDAFIPTAERLGCMPQLDQWVARHAIEFLRACPGARLHVNLSAKSLDESQLTPFIQDAVKSAGVDPSQLVFEITETAMIVNLASARLFLQQMKGLGFKTALDDFGSGFTSLSYLRELPVDIIKIDGSFIHNLDTDKVNQTLVRSMNDIAHLLGKETVAEYVETEAILETIREIGVDYAQGWHTGKPRIAAKAQMDLVATPAA
jgi:diguanylate cyclase (GGDEF)-like protein/PAS domain S-box-containing protein